MSRFNEPFDCPHCGESVPTGAAACPHCGSDENTGWSDEAHIHDPDLPTGYGQEEDFDYNEYVRKEFGWDRDRQSRQPPPARDLLLPFIAFVLIAAFIYFIL